MAFTKLQLIISSSVKLYQQPIAFIQSRKIQSTPVALAWAGDERSSSKKWKKYNDKVYPPQTADEEPRPAYVCHERMNIKYSPYKMWYIASFIRGMAVDEAIRQLKFVLKRGARDVREVLEEAKELAAKEHNVEFPSNMWVAESFTGKGIVIKGIRRHARARRGLVEYRHVHYFVRLEEGPPPKHYYLPIQNNHMNN